MRISCCIDCVNAQTLEYIQEKLKYMFENVIYMSMCVFCSEMYGSYMGVKCQLLVRKLIQVCASE